MAHSVSSVQIANMALSNVGARSSIESLDEQSAEAKQCKLWYHFARTATLAAYDWSFARKRQFLAEHSEAPPEDWAFRYIYPSDAIAIRRLTNPAGYTDDAVAYHIEADSSGATRCILTNLEEAEAVYTFDLDLPVLFSPHFIQAFSFELASHIAFSLTGKLSIKGVMEEEFGRHVRLAAAQDANQEVARKPREAEWIRARS